MCTCWPRKQVSYSNNNHAGFHPAFFQHSTGLLLSGSGTAKYYVCAAGAHFSIHRLQTSTSLRLRGNRLGLASRHHPLTDPPLETGFLLFDSWSQFKRRDGDKDLVFEDKFQYLIQATVSGSGAKLLTVNLQQLKTVAKPHTSS